MDRQSFISNKYMNENASGLCGTDDCKCDETGLETEKQVLKETRSFSLVALSVMAFLCIILFAGYKINAAKIKADQWLLAKKNAVISCSADRLGATSNGDGSMNDKYPTGNGNNCSHQQVTLCEINNSKRKTFKSHNC